MKRTLCIVLLQLLLFVNGKAQDVVTAANHFIQQLDSAEKRKALYPFDIDERYNFHFFPKDDRKGVPVNDLTEPQRKAAFALVQTSLGQKAQQQVRDIMQLENVLKALEHRKPEDHHRDPNNYYFTIFGVPGNATTWGWRLEGHHISFNFSAENKKLISGTPGFLGANPAIVLEGPQKGKQVLKEEADMGFALLHSFKNESLRKVFIDTAAPNEIITFVSRKAMIDHPAGIRYAEMNATQQQQLLQLIRLYINRYTKLLADDMLKEIQTAGLDKLYFGWAGAQEPMVGKPHYYRIQGPTIIIEYDNSQNNANHVHSVVRDLKNDFGGDMLLEHYKASH